MAYELHIDRRHVATFETTDKALEHARDLLRQNAESEVEILDSASRRAVMPASSASWREHLANEIGY